MLRAFGSPNIRPQLQAVVDEFESATARLRALQETVPDELWTRRPDPRRWSVAECVAHLNLTASAYLPLLRDGIAAGRRMNEAAPRRYRRDAIGWLLWKSMGPPVRFRTKTIASFMPGAVDSAGQAAIEFERLQREQIACVRDAEGLPLNRVTIVSPFNERMKYNLYACLTILARHQHRHLWQAEQVWEAHQQLK